MSKQMKDIIKDLAAILADPSTSEDDFELTLHTMREALWGGKASDTRPITEEFIHSIADDWEFHGGVGLWYFGSKTKAKYMKSMELHVYQEEDLQWNFNIHGVSDEDKHSYIHLDESSVKTERDFLDLCRLLNVGNKL